MICPKSKAILRYIISPYECIIAAFQSDRNSLRNTISPKFTIHVFLKSNMCILLKIDCEFLP
jgi:hypothetical protein